MKKFPSDIHFKHTWRQYQQRVLDHLPQHLKDNKLHIIAPPGSGKTVLGLEVMLRLNKPTLILAPTLAVRNQWIDRFCELFLHVDEIPDWISRDIYAPAFLTVSTYQGLHAAFNNIKNSEEEDSTETTTCTNHNAKSIVELLKAQKIATIIVDEAHHLKKEWWKSLDYLERYLEATIVGLTATPPYDVTGSEWGRYISLNGSIDEEIFVPELVATNDLCPHQDYIYFSLADAAERGVILDIREKANTIFTKIRQEEELILEFEAAPFIVNPLGHIDWIYENLESYMACLIFINDYRGAIATLHLEVLGNKNAVVPVLSFRWLEKALDFYCFKGKQFFELNADYDEKVEKLIGRLRRYGAMEHRQISLSTSQKIDTVLTASINKLASILRIVTFEYASLKEDLRMVILSDFIRKEVHVQKEVNDSVLAKLGVIPIFEYLRRNATGIKKIGVLTGSLVFIPISAQCRFEELLANRKITNAVLAPLQYDSDYLEITVNEGLKHVIVQLVTTLFEEGHIRVLVGTKALLGEGWDAPSINSLILASFVGSFVSSNQMRGRAIRSQRGNETKTANIWHLVCLDPYAEDGGNDIQKLIRRFRAFVGVSNFEEESQQMISNGTIRLNLPKSLVSHEEVEAYNNFTFSLAQDREKLSQRWQSGIAKGTSLVHTMKIPFIPIQERSSVEKAMTFYTKRTIRYAVATLSAMVGLFVFNKIVPGLFNAVLWGKMNIPGFLMWVANSVSVLYTLKFGKQALKNRRLSLKYRDISLDVRNMAVVLLDTLCHFDLITTAKKDIEIICKVSILGTIYCTLKGSSVVEGNLFVKCMHELLAPIENPRYVIERQSFLAYKNSQSDFHAVPDCIATKRNRVDFFSARWQQLVGRNRVIYTRTPQGRKELLQFRIQSLSNQLLEEPIEDENVWL